MTTWKNRVRDLDFNGTTTNFTANGCLDDFPDECARSIIDHQGQYSDEDWHTEELFIDCCEFFGQMDYVLPLKLKVDVDGEPFVVEFDPKYHDAENPTVLRYTVEAF